MTRSDDRIRVLYLYRSARPSLRHRRSVAVYLVERVAPSGVVVRIESLGLVPRALSEPELVMQGLRRGLEMVGPWNSTSSHHHTRIRLRLREP